MKEGRIKFNCELIAGKPVPQVRLKKLSEWKKRLHGMGLIGEYHQGSLKDVGFGNLSIRDGDGFIITGARTGGIAHLTSGHCVRVTAYDFDRNWLRCEGSIKASSESLTHAAVYGCDQTIGGVIHVHELSLWRRLLEKEAPATSPDALYGTPELAREIARVVQESDAREQGIIVLAGHEAGIITFGRDLDQAADVLLKHYSAARRPRD